MTKEEIEQAEKFLDAYLGGNRNVSTLTWKHWIECLADYGKKLQSENERLKAEREWISTKDNPPKDGQDVLAYQVNPDWEGNILLRWNSASFTYIEYPYYMLEPQHPKQPPKKPICCEKYMRCQDCPSSPNYINPLTSNKQ